jgi:hypothetical protein
LDEKSLKKIIMKLWIISIAVLENVPPDAGFQKRAIFSTLNVGLAMDFESLLSGLVRESNPGQLRGKQRH